MSGNQRKARARAGDMSGLPHDEKMWRLTIEPELARWGVPEKYRALTVNPFWDQPCGSGKSVEPLVAHAEWIAKHYGRRP